MTSLEENAHTYDDHGLLHTPEGNITLFRAIGDHTALDTPNNGHVSKARTRFHGIDGVYAGNTPESVSMYKMPSLIKIELGDPIEIEDLRHINNARWAGRHVLSLMNGESPQMNNKLSLVRMTPPVSLLSRRYDHTFGEQRIEPSWVIIPPHVFANAKKEIIDKR